MGKVEEAKGYKAAKADQAEGNDAARPSGKTGRPVKAAGNAPEGGAEDAAAIHGEAGYQVKDADDDVHEAQPLEDSRQGLVVREIAHKPPEGEEYAAKNNTRQ